MAWQHSATSYSDPGGYRLSDLSIHVPRFAEPLHPPQNPSLVVCESSSRSVVIGLSRFVCAISRFGPRLGCAVEGTAWSWPPPNFRPTGTVECSMLRNRQRSREPLSREPLRREHVMRSNEREVARSPIRNGRRQRVASWRSLASCMRG